MPCVAPDTQALELSGAQPASGLRAGAGPGPGSSLCFQVSGPPLTGPHSPFPAHVAAPQPGYQGHSDREPWAPVTWSSV